MKCFNNPIINTNYSHVTLWNNIFNGYEEEKKLYWSYNIKLSSKICVFMSDNRKLSYDFENTDYNSLVASINYEYCKKYNYDFYYYRPHLNNNYSINNCINPISKNMRHASWSKLLSTDQALSLNYDYIVYIDSDCIFKNFNQSIEDIIKLLLNYDTIFYNDFPWSETLPCAGFYICKTNFKNKQFINEWYNTDIPNNDTIHNWEQDALYKIYKNYNIYILNGCMFREKDGQFLRHIGSDDKHNRIPYFKDFIISNNIDYKSNILNINCVEYNTDNYVFLK